MFLFGVMSHRMFGAVYVCFLDRASFQPRTILCTVSLVDSAGYYPSHLLPDTLQHGEPSRCCSLSRAVGLGLEIVLSFVALGWSWQMHLLQRWCGSIAVNDFLLLTAARAIHTNRLVNVTVTITDYALDELGRTVRRDTENGKDTELLKSIIATFIVL